MLSGSDHAVMDWAKTLLQETDLSIRDIALKLQYSEANSFISRFRRVVGTTPTAYREGALVRRRARKQNIPLPEFQRELAIDFAPGCMAHELWLHPRTVDIRYDIQDMDISELRLFPLGAKMARLRALRKREFKSAMRRVDVEGTYAVRGFKNTVVLSLIKPSSTLEVSYQGLGCITRIEASVTIRATGPGY